MPNVLNVENIPPGEENHRPRMTVSQLPVEILCEIFILAMETELERTTRTARCISQVCAVWRTAALGCQSMWSNVAFGEDQVGPEWMREMLRRTRQMAFTLHISLYLTSAKDLRTVAIEACAPENMSRVTELKLQSDQEMTTQVLSLLSQPAPRLRSLEIHSHYECSISRDLFAGTMPSLRKLYLSYYCRLDWTASWLQNLTSLTVHQGTSLDRLLEVLSSSPLLEHLDLGQVLETPDQAKTGRPRLVRLAHLKDLVLSSDSRKLESVLVHLRLPDTAMLDIRAEFRAQTSYADVERFLAALDECGDHKLPMLARDIRNLTIGLDYRDWACNLLYQFGARAADSSPVSVILTCTSYDMPVHAVLDNALREFFMRVPSLPKLEFLALDLPDSSFLAYHALLWTCPEVHALTLTGPVFQNMIDMLAFVSHDSPGTLLFPKLRTLRIARADFSGGGLRGEDFCSMLHARESCHARLHVLEMDGVVGMSEHEKERMGTMVDIFYWDGLIMT